MLVWGRRDLILPYTGFHTALGQIDVREAVVFDNCGHMPQLEYPLEFTAQYKNFLSGKKLRAAT